MNQITDKDWEVDGYVENDWYVVPVLVLGALVALIVFIGADNFIEVMSSFIVGIRNN
jgi:hypothetical protein